MTAVFLFHILPLRVAQSHFALLQNQLEICEWHKCLKSYSSRRS